MRQREIDRHRRTLAYAREQVADALDTPSLPPAAVTLVRDVEAAIASYAVLIDQAEAEYQARHVLPVGSGP